MANKNLKTIKQVIKAGKIQSSELEKIVENYMDYSLKKSDIRKLISLYERQIMKNTGILDREIDQEKKNKLMKDFNIESIIVKNNEGIDQNLQIGDTVYTFKVKDKLRSLK